MSPPASPQAAGPARAASPAQEAELDLSRVRVLLCDADDCLFGSEGPAFEASASVTNRFLRAHGVEREFGADELRAVAAGRNFRANAATLAEQLGFDVEDEELEHWVREEREQVTAHLAAVLRPDPKVIEPVAELARRFELAVVSSSALARLDACFRASGLAALFPPEVRYSAEDSLPVPTSKPDPAVYAFAGAALGVTGDEALAIEDSVSGTRSAHAAGFPVAGNLLFVPDHERPARAEALRAAGAAFLIHSWTDLLRRLRPSS